MKIFFLLSRFPYPLEKGDKLRAFHQIKNLSKKHDIILCTLSDVPVNEEALNMLKPYCKAIKIIKLSKTHIFLNLFWTIFSGLPFQVGYFYSYSVGGIISNTINKHRPDIIFCQLIRMAEYVRIIRNTPKVLDYMDAFSKGMERRGKKVPFYLAPFFRIEHKRLLKYENKIFKDFENKIIISEQDKQQIPHPERNSITIVPNGIDTDYFSPIQQEKKYDILFVGNMSYPPNIESAVFLAKKIFPHVKKQYPRAKLLIAGASPAKKILSLKTKDIKITGWVEDMRKCYAASKIFVAPMTISIGLQNKLLEAMAMQLPCVTSSLANNAIGGNADCILVADSPKEYAEHIIELLNNPERAKKIALNGLSFVKKNYSWRNSIDKLEQVIRNTKYVK